MRNRRHHNHIRSALAATAHNPDSSVLGGVPSGGRDTTSSTDASQSNSAADSCATFRGAEVPETPENQHPNRPVIQQVRLVKLTLRGKIALAAVLPTDNGECGHASVTPFIVIVHGLLESSSKVLAEACPKSTVSVRNIREDDHPDK